MMKPASPIEDFSRLADYLGEHKIKRTAAVAWPEDDHTREAVEKAANAGFLNPIMIGSEATTDRYKGRFDTLTADSPEDASEKSVRLVREGEAQVLMKGFVNTDVLLRAVLNKEKGILPKGKVLTHVSAAMISNYHKLLFFTDPAVIPYPTQEQRVAQVEYIVNICHKFHVACPKVSLIHCTEKPDERHFPFTVGYEEIKRMAREGKFGTCIVDGPLDLKTSCSPEALQAKKIASPIEGDADALVFPDIEAGNVFYKTITLFAQTETAAVLQGTKVPVVLPSRGDSVQSKFYSLALATLITTDNEQDL